MPTKKRTGPRLAIESSALEELVASLEKLDRERRRRYPQIFAFGDKLHELESRHGIEPDRVKKILFPRGGLFAMMKDIDQLKPIRTRLKALESGDLKYPKYPENRTKEETREAKLLEALITLLTKRETAILKNLERLKLGRGKRWGVPPQQYWTLTPGEAASRNWKWWTPRQWEWIGDRAVELATYLSQKVRGERSLDLGRISATDPRPYKKAVLELTAQLVTLAYRFPYFPAFQFTPQDVKTRIEARRRSPA